MKDRVFKILKDEKGDEYRFDSNAFKAAVNHKKADAKLQDVKITTSQIISELASQFYVSTDAIKNWLYGYNGPTDIEIVKQIGIYLNIRYQELLIKEKEESVLMENKTVKNELTMAKTKEALNAVYLAMQKAVQYGEKYYMWVGNEGNDPLTVVEELFLEAEQVLRSKLLDIPVKKYREIEDYLWGTLYNYAHESDFLEELSYLESEKEQEIYNAAVANGVSHDEALKQADVDLYLDYVRYQFYSDMQELFKEYIPE